MGSERYGILLAPGAGSDSAHSSLLAIEMAIGKMMRVQRMDFPYRKAGRKAPDRGPLLVDSLMEEAAAFCRMARLRRDHLFVGGRSMGGRMASIAVAAGMPAAGLVLISYPLHPPGKPEKRRVEHFGDIRVPVLFVSGTRDAFGSPALLRRHAKSIDAPVEHAWCEGGDHGLKRFDDAVAGTVVKWLRKSIEPVQ